LNYKSNVCPYNDLFVYHLEGRFRDEDEKNLGKEYLGNWVEDNYSFLFFSADPGYGIQIILDQQSHLKLLDIYSFSYEEWQGGGFEENSVEEFIIVAPWQRSCTDIDQYKIILDPGNGLHPTTKDCIRAISFLKKHYSFKKVIDIGTGTGILAISAVCLGATDVSAVDLNPLSVKTAINNVSLNCYEKNIKVYEGRAEDFSNNKADLLIANIHFEVIKSFFSCNGFLNKKYCIFSGLMRSQVADLRELISKYDMSIIKEWEYEMTWYTILARGDLYEKQ
jgi:ribosomal protein L11 methyltransferase